MQVIKGLSFMEVLNGGEKLEACDAINSWYCTE
jgi:hypothetical protein